MRTRIPGERSEGDQFDTPLTATQVPLTYARHVEAIKERLNRAVDMRRLALALELENTLGDGCYDRVVPPFDVGQDLGETLVVIVHLWWPLDAGIGIRVVAARVQSSASRPGDHIELAHRCVRGARRRSLIFLLLSDLGFMCSGRDGLGVASGREGVS